MKQTNNPHKAFEEAFSKRHAGYVLITCDQPSASGEMKVEMTYGGGADLANMLIDGAQELLYDTSELVDESLSL